MNNPLWHKPGTKLEKLGYKKNVSEMVYAMLCGPFTRFELEKRTGITYDTLCPIINAMHERGALHISAWKQDSMGRQTIAVYTLGIGVDVPKRKPKTHAQRTSDYKIRNTVQFEDKLFKPIGKPLVSNNVIDSALREWR